MNRATRMKTYRKTQRGSGHVLKDPPQDDAGHREGHEEHDDGGQQPVRDAVH